MISWGAVAQPSAGTQTLLNSGVLDVFTTIYGAAALKYDGSVVVWGDAGFGGDASAVAASLTSGVVNIYTTNGAFAALKSNGQVITWGSSGEGGSPSASGITTQLDSCLLYTSDAADE